MRVHIGRVLGHLERDLDVALRSQVVDLVRAHTCHKRTQATAVCYVPIVQHKSPVRRHMPVPVQVVDTSRVEGRRAPNEPVHLVALG